MTAPSRFPGRNHARAPIESRIAMNPLIQLQATVVAPPGLTARTHRGVEFVVREVTWAAYPFGLAVTLMDPRTGSNTSLYPPRSEERRVGKGGRAGGWR